ncbi:glycoside hydrolase family 2 protein [Rhizobium sp. KVB221]|uniref:beta-mannosidase n=1 Tax=Rhizobium setariae TaxID=2801340 RepID=A0A936YLV5_9HYPH|nr:glycoside hydrolase family 2 protein [Rhizobium setariae]MBL0370534.1 glycoside hydrolase family 2 protein [Rhizobium setariae]
MNGTSAGLQTKHSLAGDWALVVSEAGAYALPADIPASARTIAAPVPGTVAQALERSGKFDRANPASLNDCDYWYLAAIEGERPGPGRLQFDGLATIAEVYLNGERVLESVSQFISHDIPIALTGSDQLAICFRALNPHLAVQGPRARWRPQMITPPGMRLVRATLLGHMPGWCPDVEAIGPFRAIHLVRHSEVEIDDLRIQTAIDTDGNGILDVSFGFSGRAGDLKVSCAGHTVPVTISADGRLRAHLEVPDVKPWWPHTHGEPAIFPAALVIDNVSHVLARIGFRNISLDQGPDGKGFAIEINSVPIFCRGAVWTNADIVRLPGGGEDYRPWLERARDAGMNMVRIGGTMTYETSEFFAICDELGLMVWQDFMFANFDYPASNADWVELVEREASDLLKSIQGSPSLTVLCGGSEIYQQAAMLGMPKKFWTGPLTEEILPAIYDSYRPDVIYIPNSPFGGAMPFSPNQSVTHYYGVGAYCRPLDDARRANVRFAAESLAFAHVPEQVTLDTHLPVPAVHHPRWKARVPRDRSASWDFEDIRDHYLTELYGFEPARLRREDPARYLDFSRATTVEVAEATYGEWRRPGSQTAGALVWTLQDLLPGAGWGVIDSTGLPKPVWHGLRRAFKPVQVLLSDEGTSGLDVHVINESQHPVPLLLTVRCLRDGATQVVAGSIEIELAPRGTISIPATELFGAFFDTNYAFRFGPAAHDVTVATLKDLETGAEIASAFHYPKGRPAAMHEANITASLDRRDGDWVIALSTDRLAQSVNIAVPGWLPDDNWFHLAPGQEKMVRIASFSATAGNKPEGVIRYLGVATAISI